MFNDRNLWRACFWWTDEVLRGHLVPEICHCTRGQHSLSISVNNLMQGVVISHSTGGGVWINDWASILSHANFTHSCRYLPWTCVCLRWDKKMTNTVQQKPSSQMAQMQPLYMQASRPLCPNKQTIWYNITLLLISANHISSDRHVWEKLSTNCQIYSTHAMVPNRDP